LFCVLWLYYNFSLLQTPVDPGDGIQHFFIAQASWYKPILFLDHWGKPLFILLSSTFAQFGLGGMVVFNVLVFVLTVTFAWKILDYFNVNRFFALSFPFFLLLTQDYSNTLLGGLTEPLFSLLLMIAIWFWIKEKCFFFAIFIGLLLFSRSEGMLPIVLGFLLLTYTKHWKAVPFLILPLLFYSFAGLFAFGDFFWYFTQSPYQLSNGIYGVGSYDHYLMSYKNFLGNHGLFLFILAIPATVIHFIRKEYSNTTCGMTYLSYGTFLGVILVHSYLWGTGKGGSMGLTRIATLALPSFLVCQIFFLSKTPWRWPLLSNIFALSLFWILCAYLVFTPYLKKESKPMELAVKAVYEKNKVLLEGHKVETSHPYFALLLGENYFKPNSKVHLMSSDLTKTTSPNTFVLWDSHFGPLESKIPLESLWQNPKFQLISAEKALQNAVYLFQAK
jgi:hypothetical protein